MPHPRFNLRVALAITAIAALLAWQWSIVWQRRSARVVMSDYAIDSHFPGRPSDDRPASLNPLRQIFGDVPLREISLGPEISDEEAGRIQRLFPEAIVKRLPHHHW